MNLQEYEIGLKQELTTGPASILCNVDGQVEEYSIEITDIDWNSQDTNKSFEIHVTDKNLLEKTGGNRPGNERQSDSAERKTGGRGNPRIYTGFCRRIRHFHRKYAGIHGIVFRGESENGLNP